MHYANVTNSYVTIDKIFAAKEQRGIKIGGESSRPIHTPWRELSEEYNQTWSPGRNNRYTGPSDVAPVGPSSSMLAVATEGSLALVFLTVFPLAVFAKIAEETKAYAYKD